MEINSSNELKASRYGPKNLFRLSGLSIRTRLTACFVAIVVLMIAVDGLTVWQFRRMAAAVEGLSNADQTSLAVIRVHLDIDTFRDKMAALANSHDTQQFSSEVASLEQKFLQDVGQAEQMLRASGQTEKNAAISSALETLKVTLPSQLHTAIELANAGDWTAVRLRLGQQMQDLIGLSASLVERVNQQTSLERTQAIEHTQQARRNLFILGPIAAVLTSLAAAALGWYVTRTITVPLSELTAGAGALARGDFQHRSKIFGNDELAVLAKAFNYAGSQLAHQFNMTLEARVSERTRIARELHDTLLQSFQGLLLRFQSAAKLLPERPEDARQRLDNAIQQAAEAITEGRDAVQGLRSSAFETNDLANAISAIAKELTGDTSAAESPVIDFEVEGVPRRLNPVVRDESYRIATEALRNAFRHAQARRITVEIRYDKRQFRLRVSDDGKGIDEDTMQRQPSGHFGLPGMRERAEIVGGRLEVWSKLNSGTQVELSIPGTIAYDGAPTSP
ncbi:MAG: histidine kinase [Pyrinomonadaceae bacterium]|nr:histidine kinase [Pyrinomonadaceae bacterium]